MNKRTLMLLSIILFSVTGCTKQQDGTNSISANTAMPVNTVAQSDDRPTPILGRKASVPSDSLHNYTVAINDDVFTLPMRYSEAEAMGWSLQGSNRYTTAEKELARTREGHADYTATLPLVKGGVICDVRFYNFDTSNRPLRECYITGLSFHTGNGSETGVKFTLPGGLQAAKSKGADIIPANGNPDWNSPGLEADGMLGYIE